MVNMSNSVLPNKLSDLLELAVRDARACEADPRYLLDMGKWHVPKGNGVCQVCMAGAVIAKTIQLSPDTAAELFSDESAGRVPVVYSEYLPLTAINDMRTGEFRDAWSKVVGGESMSAAQEDALDECREVIESELPEFDDEGDDFYEDAPNARVSWSTYLECVGILRQAGL